jgi:hypothetical protein
VITRILYRLHRRHRRWAEPDTLTRLPIAGSDLRQITETTDRPGEHDTFSTQPEAAGEDELLVRARLFRLLGVGRPR